MKFNGGVALRARGDAEAITVLCRRFGLKYARRLRGTFAVPIWRAQQPASDARPRLTPFLIAIGV